MTRGERERLIHLISWGKVVTVATLQNGSTARFILRPANPEDNARAAIAYEIAYRNAIQAEAMMEREALAFHKTTGVWSDQDEEQIKGLQDDIRTMVRGLLDYLFQIEKLEKVRATVRRAEKALTERLVKRMNLLVDTAEQFALTAQQRFIISRVTETDDGKPFWPTEEAFNACSDMALIARLVEFCFAGSRLEDGVIRELARTDPWRSLWCASKRGGHLFSPNICEWSHAQGELARWSHIYDMVYESMDRPSDTVVEDDDLLDSWLIRQSEKVSKGAKQTESEGLLGNHANKPGRNEVFVLADREGAKRVYDMNDPLSRGIVRQTQKVVAEKGTVREVDLPQSQREIREQLVEMERNSVLGRRK